MLLCHQDLHMCVFVSLQNLCTPAVPDMTENGFQLVMKQVLQAICLWQTFGCIHTLAAVDSTSKQSWPKMPKMISTCSKVGHLLEIHDILLTLQKQDCKAVSGIREHSQDKRLT